MHDRIHCFKKSIQITNKCVLYSATDANLGVLRFILFGRIIERERQKNLHPAIYSLMATSVGAVPACVQEAGASSGSASWVPEPKHLGHLLLLSQVH